MSEFVPIVASGVIGSLSGIFGAYVIAKRTLSDQNLADKVTMIIDYIAGNEEMQKRIYTIGGLIGKGIRDGTGIAGIVGTGKKKGGLEGIIGDLLGGWIASKMPQVGQPAQSQEQQTQRPW